MPLSTILVSLLSLQSDCCAQMMKIVTFFDLIPEFKFETLTTLLPLLLKHREVYRYILIAYTKYVRIIFSIFIINNLI
jgi:hypothetical protein